MRREFSWPKLLTESGRGLAFGGDYNPDQWPEEVWDEDIELMKRAHVNTVALAIFSWSKIQPSEHTWDFGWLDRIIAKLGAAGIAVDLASATAAAPLWLYEQHPEVLPIDRYGHVINPGSRQSWSPTSPVFKEYALAMCRKLAERYGNNSTVTAWHMGNEYGWNNRCDYSDNAQNAFRAWCQRKYGDIDALNDAWGTAFWSQRVTSFGEVIVPRHMGGDAMANPAQQLDFERFGNDMLLDFYKAERDAIAEICPDKPFTTNFMVSTDQCCMDYARWSDEVDFVSNDHYFHEGESHLDELACSDALMNGLAQGKPWYVMEHSTSAVQWKPLNARKRGGELMRDAIAHVAFGADAINFFQWRQSRSGAEAFHSAMLPHAGADSTVYREVCELGETLETLAAAGLQGAEVERSSTAILFHAESEWATRCQTLPSMQLSHWHDVRDWYRAFLDAGQRADVVPLRDDWSDYSTIVLPTVLSLSRDDTQRVADFAKAGGRVIVNYATGLIDESFRVGLGGYPGAGDGLLRDMFGVRSEEFNITSTLSPADAICPIADADEAAPDIDPAYVCLSNGSISQLWQNVVTAVADDAKVVATYEGDEAEAWEIGGVPAITIHPYGQGKAVYVGCDLSREGVAALLADPALFGGQQESQGESQQESQRESNHLIHTRRRSGHTVFDFYLNRDATPSVVPELSGDVVLAYRTSGNPNVGGRYILQRNGLLVTRTVTRTAA
ncbi:beta-galactosidase [Bifidobacterium sp. DSM 109957]|uniref:beta-galactosidase n=2 Tax=Bifidobacterium oedipodis TaxID=2675322 RepID=A0A7Y0HSL2_9BIFI|nr:beta-galactosidase [Bifidobacterium sp. DSM 109957]